MTYSPEKWLYNRIYCPSNRSKQIKETHTAYSAGTQYTRQSLNEKQHTWFNRQTVIGCEAMYVVLHSNFAAFIVSQRYKTCGFPGFVWTDCWGNKSYYVITSPANTQGLLMNDTNIADRVFNQRPHTHASLFPLTYSTETWCNSTVYDRT